ncbi:hypothetical protein TWF694_001081 [Orbilia ellipsospora]|uniref:HTH La-type RNA-binding domain-containing protein n=1 Tax=Orbilia ellipsospora TaxID=2528407 RepID=A0AAV9XR09_9PEZI
MTTATAVETKKPTFSYAAAASGKSKPSTPGTSTPEEPKKLVEADTVSDSRKDKDTPDMSQLSINGEPSAAPKDQSTGPPPQLNGTAPDDKNSSSVKGADTQSTQGENSNREDDGRSTTSGQEGASSATGNEDGDSKSGKEAGVDSKTKFKTPHLIEAPIPKENPWMIRRDFLAAQKMQADTKKPQPAVNGIPPQDKSSQTYNNDKRHNRSRSNISENRPPHQAAGGRRDGPSGIEKRGLSEAGKDGKVLSPIEDASRVSRPAGRSAKSHQDELASRDISSPPAPPSMSDKSLWPTPEVAQDEEKREKREKEEKEKEREKEKPVTAAGVRPSKDKWITMAVTPNIIYDTPLPMRGPRGPRGGRTDRGAKVGQPSTRSAGDTDTSTTPTEPVATSVFDKPRSSQAPSEQKGVQNTNSDARARRPTNPAVPAVENANVEPAAQKETAEVQKPGPIPLINGVNKPNGAPVEESSTKERKTPQTQDDVAFVGQGVLPPTPVRPKTDKPAPATGSRDQQPTQGRTNYPIHYNHKPESEINNSSGAPRDRPVGRGNFRGGRGDSNFVNHSNPRYNGGNSVRHHSPPSQINTNPHQPRQSPQYPSSPSTPQTGRSYRQNGRSHSVQQSQQFGKYGMQNGYPPQSPFVQSPSYYNNPYYNPRSGVSPSVPMQPDYEFTAAVQNVMNQLGYYFSLDNMVKDTYLRSHMDGQGWIFLDVICGFRKIKDMTKENKNIVREACIQSPDIEFRGFHPDGRERLRSARNPTEWVLKYEERDESCRHEGPIWENRYAAPPQYMNGPYPMYFQNPNMPPMPVAGPADQHFPPYNGYPQPNHMMPAFVPGQEFVPENGAAYGNGFMPPYQPFMPPTHEAQPVNGHPVPVEENLPQTDKGVRSHKKYPTHNEFSDDQVNQIVLVIRKSPVDHSAEQQEGPQTQRVMVTDQLNEALLKLEQNQEAGSESQKGKEKDDDEQLVKFYPTSPRLGPTAPASQKLNDEVGWFVDPGVSKESGRTPDITTFKLFTYPEFKNRVLGRRETDGVAAVPEIDILYRFFSHFLRKHFNLNMYNEFKSLALEDFHDGSMSGVEYLYRFHLFKIQNFPTPDLFFQDFATLASEHHHERPPYDKKMVDAVGYSKTITGSTKTRLGRFMQEKNKNFQMWPIHHHHHHHHHGGNHNHNNHGHQNSNHGANGPSVRA